MKKSFRILSVLLLLLSLAVACDPETKPTPTPTPTPTPDPPTPAASITFSLPSGSQVTLGSDGNASVELPAAGGTVSAPFSASVAWSASSNNSWCSVSPASGASGSVQFSLTIAQNTTYDDRTATVTVTAGTAKRTITVKQLAAGGMQVSPSTLDVPYTGGDFEITVQHNVDFTITVSEAAKGWISVKGTKGLTTDKVVITVAENDGTQTREGTLTFKSSAGEATVKVTQAFDDRFILSPTEVEVPSTGGTFQVEVTTKRTYQVTAKPAWVTEKSVTGTVHVFEVAKNTGDKRSDVIEFKDSTGASIYCTVVQLADSGNEEIIDGGEIK